MKKKGLKMKVYEVEIFLQWLKDFKFGVYKRQWTLGMRPAKQIKINKYAK